MRAVDPHALAKERVREILMAAREGVAVMIVDSPPGAGKTTLLNQAAALLAGAARESVMVACWTNAQAIDLALRLARSYSRVPVQLFLAANKQMLLPAILPANLTIVTSSNALVRTGVTVANASKWKASTVGLHYDVLLVDEAYQLPDFVFQQLADLADRYILVGDPGQIQPIINADLAPWGCDPQGPHVPCPQAVLARHPDVPVFQLPVSWRLRPDSAELVAQSFYDFEFGSGDPGHERRLVLDPPTSTHMADPALALLEDAGTSLAALVLPEAQIGGEEDPELAEAAATVVARILERGGRTSREGVTGATALRPEDIGIVTTHRAQVSRLSRALVAEGIAVGPTGCLAETTERWQGVERRVMIVQHPLSGLDELRDFDLGTGRACVGLSRHRVSCLVLARDGIGEALSLYSHRGERFAGRPDTEFAGFQAHRSLWQHLTDRDLLARSA